MIKTSEDPGMKLLVIEDEKKVALALKHGLEAEGYVVDAAFTGEDGFFLLNEHKYDLVVLDLMLPGRDGLEILDTIRKKNIDIPVCILTARDTLEDRVMGLDRGADDYLVKPFAFPELLARIRAMTRRRAKNDISSILTLGDLVLDRINRKATRGSRVFNLTVKEFELLEYFLIHPGEFIVSREMLSRDIWHETQRATPLDNVIDVHIAHLRKKIDEPFDLKLLQTVRGVGFIPPHGEIMRTHHTSIRFRLTLWYTAVLFLTVCAVTAIVYSFLKASLFQQMNRQINHDLTIIGEMVNEEPLSIDEIDEYNSAGLVLLKQGNSILLISDDWKREILPTDFKNQNDRFQTIRSASNERFRIRTKKLSGDVYLTMGQDEEPLWNTLVIYEITVLFTLPILLLLTGLGGYILAGRLLSPVDHIAEKARQINAENLSSRLPVENPHDEFGRLATVFNSTLSRLQDSFERLQQFTSDASHELRTPLTAIRSVGEVTLQEDHDVLVYRDCIGSMLEETDRVTRLVENLLILTRTERGRTMQTLRRVDLGDSGQPCYRKLSYPGR